MNKLRDLQKVGFPTTLTSRVDSCTRVVGARVFHMTAVESQYMETSTCEAAPRQQSRRHHSTTTFNIAKIGKHLYLFTLMQEWRKSRRAVFLPASSGDPKLPSYDWDLLWMGVIE